MKSFLKHIALIAILLSALTADGKKIGFRLAAKESKDEKTGQITAGSFRIDDSSDYSESGYSLDQISFSGFDKKLNSSTESFFVTNSTNRILTAIMLSIEYLTPDGRQLDKKYHEIKCNIPPGNTRKLDVRSWDTQHSFYYVKSAPAKASGSPFIVRFSPQAFYLRY